MNIFGVGPMEMGIIAIAALLIFGPGKLPEVMGQAGRAVRDFRRMTAELTGEFEKTIAEAQDIGKSVSGEVGAMKSQVTSVTDSVKRDLGGTGSKAKSGTKSTASKTGTASKKTTESGKKTMQAVGRTSKATTTNTPASTPKSHANTGAKVADRIVVASKDDPLSDFSLFSPEPARRERRVRRAVPTASGDGGENGHGSPSQIGDQVSAPGSVTGDDPLSRARQRRLAAGYNRRGA